MLKTTLDLDFVLQLEILVASVLVVMTAALVTYLSPQKVRCVSSKIQPSVDGEVSFVARALKGHQKTA